MVLKAFADKIIVRRKDPESELIFIPDSKNPPVEGEVVAYGPDTEFVKAGDIIVFGRYSAHKIPHGANLWIIMEADILYMVIYPEDTKEEINES